MGVAESKIGSKWETVLPKGVREGHELEKGQRLVYIDMGTYWKVVPLPKNPLKSLRGRLSKGPADFRKVRKSGIKLAEEAALKHVRERNATDRK